MTTLNTPRKPQKINQDIIIQQIGNNSDKIKVGKSILICPMKTECKET